jgi:hypothetical protein
VDPDFLAAIPHGRRVEPLNFGARELPVLPLSDGRILMTTPLWRINGEDGMAVVRLLPNGQLDPSFNAAALSHIRRWQCNPTARCS